MFQEILILIGFIINNLIENSFQSIYFISLYYIITTITTVGYGDITGQTIKEIIFQIILLIVGKKKIN